MIEKYIAPKLTRYGKIERLVQAGSLESGDLTGDGQIDTAFDTNGDGRADIVFGASGATTPVTFLFNSTSQTGYQDAIADINADFYDSDGDNKADFAIADLNNSPTLQRINSQRANYVTLSDTGLFYNAGEVGLYSAATANGVDNNTETSSQGGWDDPARD